MFGLYSVTNVTKSALFWGLKLVISDSKQSWQSNVKQNQTQINPKLNPPNKPKSTPNQLQINPKSTQNIKLESMKNPFLIVFPLFL